MAAAGVCEALGLLADGASQVLVVSVESSLPEPYQAFEAEPHPMRAWAALIEAGDEVRLEAAPSPASVSAAAPHASSLPPDLAALQVLAGASSELRQGHWHWSRHA